MTELQLYIFSGGLKEMSLSEEERTFLHTIGTTLAGHMNVQYSCYLAFMRGEECYDYIPLIGAPLHFSFDAQTSQMSIQRLDSQVSLSVRDFIQFLALVDLAFGALYPLGSVVELDRELLPADLVQSFESEQVDFYVVLSGRRVQLDEHAYIDYVGHVYPYGSRLDTMPLYISGAFIKRVISEGYRDEKDSRYCDEVLREEYFKQSIYSTMYDLEETDEN